MFYTQEALVKLLWMFLRPLFFSPEILERGSWSLGAPQRRQKFDSKAAGSAAGQPAWNTSANQPKKAVLYGVLGAWWLGRVGSTGYSGSSLMVVGQAG